MDDIPKTGLIRLSNWRDFTKIMKLLSNELWLYRGHDNADWRLKSSLEREREDRQIKRPAEVERSGIGLFKAKAKLIGASWDNDIDALIAMQHHGAKTRLVDFSTSIFVALFFAFEEMHKVSRSRAIYCINFNALCASDSLKALFLRTQKGNNRECVFSVGNRYGGRILLEAAEFRRFIIDAANEIIKNGSTENGILPLYTAATNRRQQAQAGIQLMPYTFRPFAENLAEALGIDAVDQIESPSFEIRDISHITAKNLVLPTSVIKLVFAPDMDKDAWSILDQANINPFSIYQDLIGLAKSITRTETRKLKGNDVL